MNPNEQDTELTLRTIADMLIAFREETNARLQALEERVEQGFEQVRLQMLSVDVRIDRIESTAHEALSAAHESLAVAKNTRADVKILTEEVRAWARDVQRLMRPAI
jgi:hypothetical protein